MSKLRDRIRSTFQRRSAPLGFAPRSRPDDSKAYLVVIAEVADASAATAAIGAGVDALLYGGGADGASAIVEAAGDTLVGARLPAATSDAVDSLIEAGVDFLVFDDEQTEAAALLRDDIGHVAILASADASDDELRLLQPLELDALLVPAREGTLSVREQLLTRRVAELAHKPLIVPVSTGVAADMLRVLRDAGAPAVLAVGADEAGLQQLVATAREVPAPRERREERPDPLLPAAATAPHEFEEDEE